MRIEIVVQSSEPAGSSVGDGARLNSSKLQMKSGGCRVSNNTNDGKKDTDMVAHRNRI